MARDLPTAMSLAGTSGLQLLEAARWRRAGDAYAVVMGGDTYAVVMGWLMRDGRGGG